MYRSIIQILREHTCFQHLNGSIFSKHFTLRNASKRTLAIFSSPVLLLCVHTRYNPFAHPSCTSLLFILLFLKSQYTVLAHLICFCTSYCFALFILLHILLLFLFFYHIYALVLCYFYIIFIFILLHCPLSGPDLIYISLLIIPCIIYYVTNKETLNLDTNT